MKIKNNLIKNLAKLAANDQKTDHRRLAVALERFTRSQLKLFLRWLKKYISEKTVEVKTASSIPSSDLSLIKNLFYDKLVIVKKDKTLGAGISIADYDKVINLNVKSYIEEGIAKLGQDL